jgi:hypothetical protein
VLFFLPFPFPFPLVLGLPLRPWPLARLSRLLFFEVVEFASGLGDLAALLTEFVDC